MSTFLMSMGSGMVAAAIVAVIMVAIVVYEIKKEDKPGKELKHS